MTRRRPSHSGDGSSPPPDDGTPTYGRVETKVRADVEALMSSHPMGEGLAELAFTLARTLDAGAGLAVAAVSRELRATLTDLAGMVADGDDDFEAELSTSVRDTPDTGAPEPGPEGGGGVTPPR